MLARLTFDFQRSDDDTVGVGLHGLIDSEQNALPTATDGLQRVVLEPDE